MTHPAVFLAYPPSMNRVWRTVNGRMVESKESRAWKKAAAWTAQAAGIRCMNGPVEVQVTLHPRKNKDGSASASRIDLDNAMKSALDALKSVAYQDDKQVVRIFAAVGEPVQNGGLTVAVSSINHHEEMTTTHA